jgi:predicted glycoside hydrolase/deacetylase ChbG (UPF0249 family)
MIKLIVNADDFGYSRAVNYGIIDCHKYGIVTSATMMMNMGGTSHAIALAKENPSLRVGIHLVLTCGKPLLNDVPNLTDENGFFKKIPYFKAQVDLNIEEIEREWTAQIEKFIKTGLPISHLDSHHHVHHLKALYPLIKKLAKKYDVPVRQMEKDSHFEGIKLHSDYFFSDFYKDGIRINYFEDLLRKVAPGKTVEVMTHPAYLDRDILHGSSYTHNRVEEAYLLTNMKLPKGIELV